MLPNNQWRNIATPKADQEKNQGASSAKAWNIAKNATLIQLNVKAGLLSGIAESELSIMNFSS